MKQAAQSTNTQIADSQPASSDGSSNTGSTASEELPSNPYPLNTLVEDTGSTISFYVLETFTNGVSNGAPDFLDMTHKAYDYIFGIGKEPNDIKFIYAYGPYKEGCAWKYTVYYN